MYIITELPLYGSLDNFLRQQSPAVIGFAQLIDILAQVADAMTYLEAQHVIHRDLCAANILVGDKLEVKVANFGLARFLKTRPNVAYLPLYMPDQNRIKGGFQVQSHIKAGFKC